MGFYHYRCHNRHQGGVCCSEGRYVARSCICKTYRWCVIAPGVGNRAAAVASGKFYVSRCTIIASHLVVRLSNIGCRIDRNIHNEIRRIGASVCRQGVNVTDRDRIISVVRKYFIRIVRSRTRS